MFLDTLFGRRKTQAFEAIEAGNIDALRQLLDNGLSPDAKRRALLGSQKADWNEYLLTYAIQKRQFDAATLLMERGANPHVHDNVTGELKDCLLRQMHLYNVMPSGANVNVDEKSHPVLHCMVVLLWHRPLHQAPRGLTPLNFDRLPLPAEDRDAFDVWVNDALKSYQAHRENKELYQQLQEQLEARTVTEEAAPPPKRKM